MTLVKSSSIIGRRLLSIGEGSDLRSTPLAVKRLFGKQSFRGPTVFSQAAPLAHGMPWTNLFQLRHDFDEQFDHGPGEPLRGSTAGLFLYAPWRSS